MSPVRTVAAAKINLALVVGPRRADGLHEVATVLQRVDVCDRVELGRAAALEVQGFPEDTIVGEALTLLAAEAGVEPAWRVRLAKEIPVSAGLGGGSADAAAALRVANAQLSEPLEAGRLHTVAASVGADVPFFLEPGPKLAEGAGERLTAIDLPQDFWVVVVLSAGAEKPSTAEVYRRYDELGGGPGFAERRSELLRALAAVRRPADLAALPPNDLADVSDAGSATEELGRAGAFRADVSGAGPAVYGLFEDRRGARAAGRRLGAGNRCWIAPPVW